MTVNKRKKNSRHRGSTRHGWGTKKRHRGAGNRGGRGMAGTGKRADSKKPSIWKKDYFGKYGFMAIKRKKIIAQNIDYFEKNLDMLVKRKVILTEGDYFVIDSKKLGFNKLLGRGKITKKFKIYVPYASRKAIESVEKNGGVVYCSENENKEGV